MDEVAVGIEAAEERVGQRHLPDIVLDLHPVLDDFRPLDLDLLARRGLIDDALRVGFASARRVDALAINAFMHGDHIARLRQIRGVLNGAKRRGFAPSIGVAAAAGHVKLGSVDSGTNAGDREELNEGRLH